MDRFKNCYWRMIFLVMLAGQGCITDDGGKEVIVKVDEEFKFGMNEVLGATRKLSFELESIDEEECLNSTIDLSVIPQTDKITLNLFGIKPAIDCNPGIAPARSSVNLGELNNGIYDFLIVVGNTVENEGKLTASDSKYELNMYSTDGLVISNKILNRIPNKIIWGYIAYDDALSVGSAPGEFMADLEMIAQPHQLPSGYFGYFEVKNNGEIILRSAPQNAFYHYFIYRFDGTETELKGILENYRASYPNDILQIAIYTSEGKVL